MRDLRDALKGPPRPDVREPLPLGPRIVRAQIGEGNARPADVHLGGERFGDALSGDPARREQADRLGQQHVLGRVNRILERVPVAVGWHRHGTLHDPWARVDTLVDEMDGHPGHLDPSLQRLADRIQARESRQQGGVDVHDPVAPALDEAGREKLHVPSEHNQVGLWSASQPEIAASRVSRVEAVAGKALGGDPASAARSSAIAPGLSEATATTSIPSRP